MKITDMVDKVMEKVFNDNKKETILIKAKAANTSITDSKFGGLPYIKSSQDIPLNHRGEQLMLLAQINCQELPINNIYPAKGLLQFWINGDGQDFDFGLDFTDQVTQKNFRIIYQENIENNIQPDFIKDCYKPKNDCSPFDKYSDYSLDFERKETNISIATYEFEKVFIAIWNEFYPKNKLESLWAEDEIGEYLFNNYYHAEGHKIGGYPHFTQTDPRERNNYRNYTELLLQVDSDYYESSWNIIWGDVGVANFFIKKEDLKKKNFSDVLYNWDCS